MTFFEIWIFLSLVFLAFFLLDDVFLDFLSAWKLRRIPQWRDKKLTEKSIGILMANWQESSILEAAVTHNLELIEYKNFRIYLGVYPNDKETLKAAIRLAEKNKNIEVIVNTRNGPSSKGQMLNQIFKEIHHSPNQPDLYLIHDAEDIIHPNSLSLINEASLEAEFIQVPVFPFAPHWSSLIGGLYLDEFSESHCKELPCRAQLQCSLPSAGVGTALKASLVDMILENEKQVFLPDCLTEDYILGIKSYRQGVRAQFVLKRNGREIIATRECFPRKLWASLKQKTRWMVGISFQGWEKLSWQGKPLERYFLWRDRKAPLRGIISASAFLALIFILSGTATPSSFEKGVLALNFALLIIRFFVKAWALFTVYRSFVLIFTLPFRWIVAALVDGTVSLRSLYQYSLESVGWRRLKWAKTDHELPTEIFGVKST